MPSLTIHPPRQQSTSQSSPPPQLPPLAPAGSPSSASYPLQGPTSPVAPEYSPITPRAQPALPATYPPANQSAAETIFSAETNGQAVQTPSSIAPTADYIPRPPPQPFSGEDATDAIALRAAISSLQFQKKKAQDDIRTLEKIRKQALDDPAAFKSELAAGRLNEQKPKVANLQAILDQAESDDDDDEIVLGTSDGSGRDAERQDSPQPRARAAEVPDSQASRPTTSSSAQQSPPKDKSAPFERIPGPQNVVRMPHVNWEKYHITGEPLDSMHEQQRRWPGNFAYGQDRGREQVVAAPYSPWLDPLEGQQRWDMERRNDSISTLGTAVTPTTTVSEHPMETRRSKMNQ